MAIEIKGKEGIIMRRLPAFIVVLLLSMALVPAHGAAAIVDGYGDGYYSGFGNVDDWLSISIGTGGPVYVPGALVGGGAGAGVANIQLQKADYTAGFDVVVPLGYGRISSDGDNKIFTARGIGSDGACYGVNVSTAGYEDGFTYAGVHRAAASTITDDSGPCVATDREFLAYGGFRIQEV